MRITCGVLGDPHPFHTPSLQGVKTHHEPQALGTLNDCIVLRDIIRFVLTVSDFPVSLRPINAGCLLCISVVQIRYVAGKKAEVTGRNTWLFLYKKK